MKRPPLYQLDGVSKTYRSSFGLRIDHLEVHAGEILCLVGPTGAGKSTLLRLLSGLEPATAGTLQFDGLLHSGGKIPLQTARRITMVYQRPLLLAGSVRYNVEYPLKIRRRQTAAADAVLQRLELTKIANQSARTLSGGQTQLVALARSLVIEPDVLLLDEPTANLDPGFVALVEQTLLEMQRQRTMTVVWATHNIFQARRVADRVGLLLGGSLIEVAATEEFFECPVDDRTAQFVEGKMVY